MAGIACVNAVEIKKIKDKGGIFYDKRAKGTIGGLEG